MPGDHEKKSGPQDLPSAMDDIPSNLLEAGYWLAQKAQALAKEKGISKFQAMEELAERLPEPLRSAALETVRDLRGKHGV